ncbi:hypothetical protein GGR57DRAFT_232595 [Xylariaceae sp. FL1272]|nr:hypothetical protein GGR57DRAFT_232595 [Xylariaceae sp. FL1272]
MHALVDLGLRARARYVDVSTHVALVFSSPSSTFVSTSRQTTSSHKLIGCKPAVSPTVRSVIHRDEGLPFPGYSSHVDRRLGIPVRAILWRELIIAIQGLINLGSSTTFSALVSLELLGRYTSLVFLS